MSEGFRAAFGGGDSESGEEEQNWDNASPPEADELNILPELATLSKTQAALSEAEVHDVLYEIDELVSSLS